MVSAKLYSLLGLTIERGQCLASADERNQLS